MIGPIGITEKQAEEYLEFLVDLTDSQRVVWKITRPDGTSVMLVPVNEVPPVPLEIQQDVEKFREKFLEPDAT
jgi:hypothetical protein|tara:strand:+ start:328 stop:546 length:219 start_codon:yes stop_codon:yes gene_type:complete